MKKSFAMNWVSGFDLINPKVDNFNVGKPFKLKFSNKQCNRVKNSNTVICTMNAIMYWNIPAGFWCDCMMSQEDVQFNVKGVAICNENDEFDYKTGCAIATTRAENEAYKEAFRRLSLLMTQFDRISLCCADNMRKMNKYFEHNEEHLKYVIDNVRCKK